ncbi:DUF2975 domain-containing protein [Flavihumibacter sp. CACIAM 22H1]|uniref:DUF2975 domain-containing protein n=1 Tax=Flavihumibacter sp. CACIAM 22H1 TaxID=1812911 RepID=UPI0007A92143|nr:DUF2975 domain-containing protein [Flavihumibacter sp. CACIAM 22H1]KYP14102.1 MAG: hypothetical protein A1D16_00080 [Flavihumibacter sp. CACIAM 22H1]
MQATRLLARLLFYFSRAMALLYGIFFLLSAISLSTGWGLRLREGGRYFSVNYPFSEKHLLNGDYNATYISLYFLSVIFWYFLFCWLLGNVFRVFFQPRLFTDNGVKHLRNFYLANFLLPILHLVATLLFDTLEADAVALVLLHIVVGVFAYFLAAIFRQGLQLQKEQDLYI